MAQAADQRLDLGLVRVDARYAAVLAELQAACFATPWGEEAFARLLALPGHKAWLVMRGDEPLGYSLYQLVGDEGELLSIAVLPRVQGQGLGVWLLRKTLDHCKTLGISRIILDVDVNNVAARALYEKLAFTQVGIRKNYYHTSDGSRADALVLAREEIT